MNRKKLFTSLTTLFSVVLLSTTAGCSSSNNTSDTTTSLNSNKVTVWCWDQSFNGKALSFAQEIYQKDHPDFELEIIDLSKTDLEQKLTTNLASGITNSLPDIILVNDTNAQKYVESYPNTFADLTNAVDYSNFVPYKVASVTVEDKVYGVPFDVGVAGLFYRTDYLEEAGFSAEDLQNITWDRFIEIGKVVYEKTGKYLCTINPNDETLISIMLQSAGSWFITGENKGNFTDNPVMDESLQVYYELASSGIVKPVTGWSEFVNSFNNGDVATVISGVWQIATIMDGTDQSGKWGVAPIPSLDVAGATNASNEGGSSWFVLDNAANKEIAIDFLSSTFGNNTELYEQFLTECGGVASYLPAFESDVFAQQVEFFGGQQIYSLFSNWLTEVPSISFGTYTQEAKDALKNELPSIINGSSISDSLENTQKLFTQQVQ